MQWIRTHILQTFLILFGFTVAVGSGIGLFLVAQQLHSQNIPPTIVDNPPDITPEQNVVSPAFVELIFAGDLNTNEGCADHGTSDACDLFTAKLNITDGTISNTLQRTTTELSESYPAWHPSGTRAYFTTLIDVKHKDLGTINLDTGVTTVMQSNATWAEVHPDASSFLYVSEMTDKIMSASLSDDGMTLTNATPLTDVAQQQDPAFSADGRYVIFHETSTGIGIANVYDTTTQTTASYGMQSGHCTIGWTGLLTLCDNVRVGGILASTYENTDLSTPILRIKDPTPAELATHDPAFASCNGTSFNYPTFCGDDNHVVVSASCNVGGSVSFSRLFLVDISSRYPVYFPIGASLADAFNGPGQSTWTADCLAIE